MTPAITRAGEVCATDRRLARELAAAWGQRGDGGRSLARRRGAAGDGDAAQLAKDVAAAVDAGGGVAVYTTGLSILGQWGLLKEARRMEQQMNARGVPHDVFSLTALMSAHAHHGDVVNVRRLYHRCCALTRDRPGRNHEVNNPTTLNTVLLAHVAHRDTAGALEAYHYFTRTAHIAANIVMITTVLKAFEAYAPARRFFDEELRRHKLAPTIVTFNNLVGACVAGGDTVGAADVLALMEVEGVVPSSVTYTLLMAVHRTAGDIPGALACYRRILDPATPPTAQEFVRCVAAAGDAALVPAARAAYDRVYSGDAGAKPDLSLVTSLCETYDAYGMAAEAEALLSDVARHYRQLPPALTARAA